MKKKIFTFYFILVLIDLHFFIVFDKKGGDIAWLYIFLLLAEQILLPYFYINIIIIFFKEARNRFDLRNNLILLIFVIFFDLIKIYIFRYHPFLPILKTMDIQSKEDEQETRNREKREKYKTIYLNEPFSENKIFRNDKLQTGIIYNGIINNINIKFKKSLYLDLNNFIPFEYANILSFEQKRNYTTEISSTDYDKILTFRTKEGEISFFINNEKIQNCIYDSSFSNLNFSFLKRCHQKSEYYDEFWKSILRNYCRQRKLEFRYSNECDNLLF